MTPRILVADDSATIQKVVELTFSKEDFQIVKAVSGQEAIAKARETRPDIVLLDLSMPDKSGYEVCESLRSDPLLRDTPIILLVGAFESFDQERGRKAGADDFVTKPFESKQLIAKVKQHIFARTARLSAEKAEVEPQAEVLPTEPSGFGLSAVSRGVGAKPEHGMFPLEPEPAISVPKPEGLGIAGEEARKEPSWEWEEAPVSAAVSGAEPAGKEEIEGSVTDEELWKMLDLSAPEAEPLLPGPMTKEEGDLALVAEDSPEAFFELYSQPIPPAGAKKEGEGEAGQAVAEIEPKVAAPGEYGEEAVEEMISFDNLPQAILVEEEEEVPSPGVDRGGGLEGLAPSEEAREAGEEIGIAEAEVEVAIGEEEARAALTEEELEEVAISGQVVESIADRIVKEVTERLVSRIEKIIWEVVPDLAEVLITKEIEKIKALAEEEKEIS